MDVSPDEVEILCMKVTTNGKEKFETIVEIVEYLKAGLAKPSYAVISKIRVLKKERFGQYIGRIQDEDMLNIMEATYKNEYL
ncbi:PemK-like protein [Mycobacterium tuberculosis]|nr:PemK-like protein [Mycobacterium tuberculosis]